MSNLPLSFSQILKWSFLTGTLDILCAFVDAWFSFSVGPARVLQFIASGILGDDAYQDSGLSIGVGLGLHYVIAGIWTFIFFLGYEFFQKIIPSKLLQAFFLGLLIWLVMNLLILPFTAISPSPMEWFTAVKGILILSFAFGIPLVFFATPTQKSA